MANQFSSIGTEIANMIREIVLNIIDVLTPILDVLGVSMIVIGLILALGLRQEFLGWRLVVGGAITLLTVHFIIPMLTGYL